MMKKIILGLIILMMSSMVFAGDYDPETGLVTVQLHKGWNLVPTGSTTELGNCTDSLSYMYLYSNYQKSYVGAKLAANQPNPGLNAIEYYPNREAFDLLQQDEYKYPNSTNNPYYGLMGFGGMWFYSNSSCSIKQGIGRLNDMSGITQDFLNERKLKQGWNFINVSPWMLEKTFKDVFKSCTVTSANMWDSSGQKWIFPSSSEFANNLMNATPNATFRESSMQQNSIVLGSILIIKVTSDCTLNKGSEVTGPPTLPN